MRIQLAVPLCALGLALAGPAQAENFARGQELFEHHCRGCHDDLRSAAKAGKAKTVEALRKKIASWAEHGGTQWGDSEVDDVLFYLNESFYHLKNDES